MVREVIGLRKTLILLITELVYCKPLYTLSSIIQLITVITLAQLCSKVDCARSVDIFKPHYVNEHIFCEHWFTSI